MKTLLITLAGVATIAAAMPATAGPDWQVIEQARKAKHAQLQREAAATAQSTGSSGASGDTAQADEARRQQMMKDCMDMMKKS